LWVLDGAIDAKPKSRPAPRAEPIAPPASTGLHAAMSFLASVTKKERPE
jgi:hypothetical protein